MNLGSSPSRIRTNHRGSGQFDSEAYLNLPDPWLLMCRRKILRRSDKDRRHSFAPRVTHRLSCLTAKLIDAFGKIPKVPALLRVSRGTKPANGYNNLAKSV